MWEEDVKYLEYIDEFPFVDTPLHTAASAGNIPVAMEIMRLKPSFARKPNQYGFSPIDFALLNGHTEMVHQLLHVDQDLVRVKDSIVDVTTQNETALHIALKNDNIKSFKALAGWLASSWSQNASDYERKILNWKDEEGNTVLHIAVSKKQTEAVSHLFAWSNEVDTKIKNKEGKTAWEIGDSEMKKMLNRVGASKDNDRNVFLVVAALLITVTYQAALSPPGGFHESISQPDMDDATYDRTLPISTSQAYKPSQVGGDTAMPKRNVANLLNTIPFSMFLFSNSVTFLISNSVTILLIPDGALSDPTTGLFCLDKNKNKASWSRPTLFADLLTGEDYIDEEKKNSLAWRLELRVESSPTLQH
nr:ankyrin repeat-containing protein bda1 [Quercus suber]